MNLVQQVRRAGVVGAGGGGYPAHVKLAAKADTVIANGAECEPLLHKDAALMEHEADAMVQGMRLAMAAVGADTGIIGIKAKNRQAVDAVRTACEGSPLRLHLLSDYYPAGDEYDLVHETTGRLIPPGGIPLNVGAVVSNVESLINIAAAAEGRPVTHKTLTIAGAVGNPQTMRVPLGTSVQACIEAAGGAAVPDPVGCLGGMMMGDTIEDFSRPVTKTTGGLIVLPRSHRIMQRKLKPAVQQHSIGKSACDQCRYCTEYCPRFLLGYPVEPHQIMRSLSFTATGAAHWNEWASLCCSCGLCTLFACPEELFPKEACDQSKAEMKLAGLKWSGATTVKPHAMRDGRRVPIKGLMRKLHIAQYDHPAPLSAVAIDPTTVTMLLKQGAGSAAQATVRRGDRVTFGQMIADLPEKLLGVPVHAPFDAVVADVTAQAILLNRS